MRTWVTWPVIVALALLVPWARSAAASQNGGDELSTLGLNRVAIRIAADRVDVPNTVGAGRTLLAVQNTDSRPRQAILAQLPDGHSVDELTAGSNDPRDLPSWFFASYFPGFPAEIPPGETRSVVVDLIPGTYALIGDVTASFVVGVGAAAAGTPAATPTVPADATIRLYEFGFQLPAPLPAGHHLLEILNAGRLPHALAILRSPAPLTREQAMQLVLSGDSQATPEGGGPRAADLTKAGGIGWLTQGATAWTEIDLEPGTYVLACQVYDPSTGMTHAMEGMVDVITVS
jgi:hypothetical protein